MTFKTEEAKLREEIERIDKLKKDMTSECWLNSQSKINRFEAEAKLQQLLADKNMIKDAVEEIKFRKDFTQVVNAEELLKSLGIQEGE